MRVVKIALFGLMFVAPLSAQTDTLKATGDTLPPAHFFSPKDAYVAAAFTGISIIATRLDTKLAEKLQTSNNQSNKVIRNGAKFFKFMGQPAPQIIGGGLYVTGRLIKNRSVAELGLHGLESMFMSDAITTSVKLIAGRARPCRPCSPDSLNVPNRRDSTSTDFKLFRGFKGRDYQSFPSGHATTAFAAAAAVTAESEHFWPGHQVLVGSVLFTGASLVGVSRMYDDQHWASDVVVGAMVGTFSGFKVVKFNHNHPHNRIDRALLSIELTPNPNGGMYVGQTIKVGGAKITQK